jgi:hypothetical protein
MERGLALALGVVSLASLGLACEPRYQIETGKTSGADGGESIVYRLDRETGEICVFWTLIDPLNDLQHGSLYQIGTCKGAKAN